MRVDKDQNDSEKFLTCVSDDRIFIIVKKKENDSENVTVYFKTIGLSTVHGGLEYI